jgi:hypothetical protein
MSILDDLYEGERMPCCNGSASKVVLVYSNRHHRVVECPCGACFAVVCAGYDTPLDVRATFISVLDGKGDTCYCRDRRPIRFRGPNERKEP